MRTCLRTLWGLLLAMWCSAQFGQAQAPKIEYIDTPQVIDLKKARAAEDYLNGKTNDAEAAATVPALVRSEMAKFTEIKYDGRLPKFKQVKGTISNWLNADKQTPEARLKLVTELNTVAFAYATNDKYLPVHRINAIYIIAELDEARDYKAGTRTPYIKATSSLINILRDPNQVDFVKVPALAALERHVRDGWKSWKPQIKDTVREVVTGYATSQPKPETDRSVYAWMVRRALDMLRVMEADDAVDAALGYLADPKALPSLRGSALEYLQSLDVSKFDADRKKLYMLGLVHYLRSQLVDWYQIETDHSKRKSGGGIGGEGGFGGGMGGMGGMSGSGDGGEGSGMGGYGGSMGGMGGMEGGGDGGFGSGRGSSGMSKPKLNEVQDWQARIARRRLNELTQSVRRAIDGKRLSSDSGNAVAKMYLSKAEVTFDEDYKLSKLVSLVEDLQKAFNDPNKIRSVTNLMNFTKKPIEEIMDFAKKTPGFLEKYPELKTDEELEEATEQTLDNGQKGGDKPSDGTGGEKSGGAPTGDGKAGDGKAGDGKAGDGKAGDGNGGGAAKP